MQVVELLLEKEKEYDSRTIIGYRYGQSEAYSMKEDTLLGEEGFMLAKPFTLFRVICGILFIFSFVETVQGQGISPAHEQEFMDARVAMEAAQTAKADKYAPDKLKEATEFLRKAERARSAKDDVQFSQASNLSRVVAESAKAWTELKIEQEKLSATNVELQKIKADIQHLKEAQ